MMVNDELIAEIKKKIYGQEKTLKRIIGEKHAAAKELENLFLWIWALIEIYEGRPFSLELFKEQVKVDKAGKGGVA